MSKKSARDLIAENQELRIRLEEAQETIDAIRRGEVDGLVVSTPKGEQVYTLTSAEKPYRALIEEMREGAVMLSDDNIVLYCNNGFAKMIKQPTQKIVGVNIKNLVCPTSIDSLNELLKLARKRKGPVSKEVTLRTNGDIITPTLMSATNLQSDTLKNTFLVATDLTQHMEDEVKSYTRDLELSQIALSESEQRWETTLSSIGDAVIATDEFGKIRFMNNVAERLTGRRLNEAFGMSVQEIFKIANEFSHEVVENPVSKILEKGVIVSLTDHRLLIRKDGIEVPIADSGAPIKNKDGKITGVVFVFRDITSRREMELKLDEYRKHLEELVEERTKQLRDSERLVAIGLTAGMVGHDIRNPLQSIMSELYLAKTEIAPMPESQTKSSMIESLANIGVEVEYINKIVQDLQDFAKPITAVAKNIDLQVICEEIMLKYNIPENIKTTCRIEAGTKTIFADPDAMKRAIGNLVRNAIQAMPKGGKLTITAHTEKGNTIITIEDTGVGIPNEIRSKIFTPLVTTKAKGQGFGLAVVKRMIEAQKGSVTFESKQGEGTKFIIRLPTKQPEVE